MSMRPNHRERRVTSHDGLSLYYRDFGDARSKRLPVLCLAGLTRNSADFLDLAEHLSITRRVVCPDYRGRGRSAYDRNPRNYATPHAYLGDIHDVMAAAGLHRAVVIGTSFGAILTMGLAVQRPTAIAGAVINDAGPEMADGGLGRIMTELASAKPLPDWESAVAFLKRSMPILSVRSEEGWRKLAHATFREDEKGLIHFDWDGKLIKPLAQGRSALPDLWSYYRALAQVPVLAVRGALSDVLSVDTFERMARAKPDLVRVTVEGSGHAPTLSEPVVTQALDDFLDRF